MKPFFPLCLAALLSLSLTACTSNESSAPSQDGAIPPSSTAVQYDPDTPPEISVTLGETTVPTSMRQEYWNGSVVCGEDLVVALMQGTNITQIPVAASGETLKISFPADAQPDSVRLLTEPRTVEGRAIDSTPQMSALELTLQSGMGEVVIPAYDADAQLQGFLLEAVWGKNNCWYAFAVIPAPADGTTK